MSHLQQQKNNNEHLSIDIFSYTLVKSLTLFGGVIDFIFSVEGMSFQMSSFLGMANFFLFLILSELLECYS